MAGHVGTITNTRYKRETGQREGWIPVPFGRSSAEKLSKMDVKLRNLITLQEIVEALYKRSDIDESTKQAIRDYMK